MEGNVGSAGEAPPEPGARSALGHGWGTMKDHFWTFLWMIVAYYLVLGVGVGLRFGVGMATNEVAASLVYFGWTLVVVGPLGVGLAYAYLEGARGGSPGVDELTAGFPHVVSLVGAGILTGLVVGLGLLLLILPGIYAGIRLFFTALLIVDRDMGAVEAMKASWNHTGGHVLGIFGLGLASVVILLGGALLLLVGIVPAAIWVGAATASYYHAVVDGGGAVPAGGAREPQRVPEAGGAGTT